MLIYSEDFKKEREDRGREHTRYLEAEERAKKAEQRVMDLETIVNALT